MNGNKVILKKFLLIVMVIPMHIVLSFIIDSENKKIKYQQNFWPIIRGKWWPLPDESDNIIRMQRIDLRYGCIDFFSKDSCEMDMIRYDDTHFTEKYKWINSIDTLKIFRRTDTLIMKVIRLTKSEFFFKSTK